MTTLACINPIQRQTAVAMSKNNRNRMDSGREDGKSAALETISQLRALLEQVESDITNDELQQRDLQRQASEWEALNREAMEAVRAIACERKAFNRRMSGQAALSGLRFP